MASTCLLMGQSNQDKVLQRIDRLLERELKKKDVHNVYLSLYSPSKDFEWHSAKGTFKDGSEVTLKNPFYTASIGKTFTATAIGLLVDQGKIRFEDPISKYLTRETTDGLHVWNGVDYSDSIQVSHLLQHTSGLPDYFDTQTLDGTPSLFELLVTDPNRFWTPEELISFSKAHFKPSFSPGRGYRYTDTEYVLLGMIIEKVSGMALHDFLATHIFDPLTMNQTYLNQRSQPSSSVQTMAEMYLGSQEISTFKSLSADWAGGAIVSTGKDLITFQKALMKGELVSEQTLALMQQWTPETKGMTYGFGLRKIEFKELAPILPRWHVVGHSGLNGTSMYYCPELDMYLVSTLNQLETSKEAVMLMVKVLMQCEKI
ncbi:beta-lactamase family protein [bacterium SCSIO 12741]|nr:beta-lactamase family protein [bacterium SCSIO 12741]